MTTARALACFALLMLTACGMGQEMQRGGAALEEASQRGYRGFIDCERQRNLMRMGFKGDLRRCPPVE